MKSNLKSQLGSRFDLNDDSMIDNNLLKMDIFYKEFNFENIVETPAYTVGTNHIHCVCVSISVVY